MTTPDWLTWVKQAERLFDRKQLDEAAELAERAFRINSDCALAHQVLGLVSSERGFLQDAMSRLTRGPLLQPDLVHSHNGLGRCYCLLGDIERALRCFNTALCLQPDHAFARFNRATVLLKQGRYQDGWLEYEWRWKCGLVKRPDIPRPRWDGSPLNGKGILVHTEQGLGDVLQFIRFLPELKRRGGRLVLACQKGLRPFLRQLSYVDEWFPIDEPGPISFQVYAPLLSLPALLGIEAETIPHAVPYLAADPERIQHWRPRTQGLPGFKVGLCWQGSPTFKGDRYRSVALSHFAPLAEVVGFTLVSLQKAAGTEQIEPNRQRVPMHVFADLDREAVFVDMAAVIEQLDLVITCDTSVAHLAGALGRPAWVLLPTGSDWRWLVDRSDSPWYPTMRLFRQKSLGDWPGVFDQVAAALRAAIGASRLA